MPQAPINVNKLCGSGMKAIMLGANSIRSGEFDIVVAGGMESMTNAPYVLPKARGGYRMGDGEIKDTMFLDGLKDADTGKLMGAFAQEMADKRVSHVKRWMHCYRIWQTRQYCHQ